MEKTQSDTNSGSKESRTQISYYYATKLTAASTRVGDNEVATEDPI